MPVVISQLVAGPAVDSEQGLTVDPDGWTLPGAGFGKSGVDLAIADSQRPPAVAFAPLTKAIPAAWASPWAGEPANGRAARTS